MGDRELRRRFRGEGGRTIHALEWRTEEGMNVHVVRICSFL